MSPWVLGFLFISAVAQVAEGANAVTCGCEWSPFTRVSYLSCAEIRTDGHPIAVVSQKPFSLDSECRAEAVRVELRPTQTDRAPSNRETPNEVNCECDWNPWRNNFLLSCRAWFDGAPAVRILDRMAFGGPKGHKGEAERSCFAAKSTIETFARRGR